MNSSYWDSVYNHWKDRASGIDASNYYDQSFVDRMNRAQENIDNLVSVENQANSKAQASKDAYDTFKGEMRHYADVNEEQENEFGVQTAFEQYEKSKDAIAATQAMIKALPSTINANSNRVLTQSQREAAFQRQYSQSYGRKLSSENTQVSQYEETWTKARENASKASAEIMAAQQNSLSDFNKAWASAMDNWYQAQENVRTAQYQKYDIESQYREWQRQQAARDRQMAMKEMSLALDAYIATLKNESTMRIADIRASIDRTKDLYNESAKSFAQTITNYWQTNKYGYTQAW